MAETLTAKEKAFNHEDGQGVIEKLEGIREALATGFGPTGRKCYSFHINGSESDPASMINYMDDAVGMTPAKMDLTTGVFSWGSWRNAFFIPKPCMVKYDGSRDYYLDENDYTKKEDGSASDVANLDYGGNAMMEWGRDNTIIWIRVKADASSDDSGTVSIANYKVNDEFHAWNFYDKNNVLKDHFYTPIYQGCVDDSGRLRSISGQVHCKNKNASGEMAAAALNGDKWTIETFADRMLFTFILYLMGKSTATQEVFGLGHSTDSWTEANLLKSGTMDKKGLFFGNSNSGTGGDGVKVLGMENPWGDQWRRMAGLINNKGVISYKLTRGTADGTSVSDYNITAEGYKTINGKTPSGTSGGYINKCVFNDDSMFPITASGSDSTFYCDGLWLNNGQLNFACVGGALGDGRHCGALCFALHYPPSTARWDLGASVSCR